MPLAKPSDEPAQQAFIIQEKIHALYMQALTSNLAVIIISVIFFTILAGHVDSSLLAAWMFFMIATASYRLWLRYRYQRSEQSHHAHYWLNHYTLASFIVGIGWSLIYLFLNDLSNQVVLIALFMLFFGVTSSSVAILSIHLPAFVAYSYPQALVMMCMLFMPGDMAFTIISLSLLVFITMLTLFARNTNRQFVSHIILASENQALVEQLNEEVEQRQQVIQQRTQELKDEIEVRKKVEDMTQVQYRLIRSVIDATPDLIFYKDYKHQDGRYIGSNRAFSKFTGLDTNEIIGKNDIEIFGQEVGDFFREMDRAMLDARETRINEEWVTYPNGQKVLLSTLKTPLYDSDDSTLGVLGVSRDITEQKKTEQILLDQKESLKHLAHHDPLTNLPNRLLLIDRLNLARKIVDRNNKKLAVFFIDLDHFKDINDSLGHSIGDELLKAAAQRLLKCVREEDTVARLGGDEFTILMIDLDDSLSANRLAKKIIREFEYPFHIKDQTLTITTSIGISIYPTDGNNSEDLLRNADAAMYRSKSEGRNTFRFYDQDMTERARARITMEADLRSAITNEEFELHFQPQIDFNSGQLVGAEALIRWNHPKQGLIAPAVFIDIAEETGQIIQIGDWVIQTACKLLEQWESQGRNDLRLAVNISGRQLSHNSLTESINHALDNHHCKPSNLEIEITEGFLVERPEKSREALQKIRDQGISIAIDDFGTGYSSLSYLKQFPISKLKIDASFVRDIQQDSNDQAIISAIIALGQSLDLTVIAEGVETKAQAEYLSAQNCDQAQGYLYSRPLNEKSFIEFWERHEETHSDLTIPGRD